MGEMAGTQEVVDVDEGLLGERPDGLAIDRHDLVA